LADIDASLGYVRRQKPRAVILENVATAWVVAGVTDLVGRIKGYQWRTARLDPRESMGLPVSRVRQYWVGVRVGE